VSNILPTLIYIQNNMYEICVKTFLKRKFMFAPSFLVFAHLTTCVCARAQLRGNVAGFYINFTAEFARVRLRKSEGANLATLTPSMVQRESWHRCQNRTSSRREEEQFAQSNNNNQKETIIKCRSKAKRSQQLTYVDSTLLSFARRELLNNSWSLH